MGAARKLQGEIDKVLKKVQEGIEEFDQIWNKVHDTENVNQKEKYEADLKKEIKKLQRLRDQIKAWISGADIKDKTPLLEARKNIEREMERFKLCEREAKMKAFSKAALGQADKLDPREQAKAEARDWINGTVETLSMQVDEFEYEMEELNANIKKKQKPPARLHHLETCVGLHKEHMNALDKVLRCLENDTVEAGEVEELKDSLEYYLQQVSDNTSLDQVGTVQELYESLQDRLEAVETAAPAAPLVHAVKHKMDKKEKEKDDSEKEKPVTQPKIALVAPVPRAEPAGRQRQSEDDERKVAGPRGTTGPGPVPPPPSGPPPSPSPSLPSSVASLPATPSAPPPPALPKGVASLKEVTDTLSTVPPPPPPTTQAAPGTPHNVPASPLTRAPSGPMSPKAGLSPLPSPLQPPPPPVSEEARHGPGGPTPIPAVSGPLPAMHLLGPGPPMAPSFAAAASAVTNGPTRVNGPGKDLGMGAWGSGGTPIAPKPTGPLPGTPPANKPAPAEVKPEVQAPTTAVQNGMAAKPTPAAKPTVVEAIENQHKQQQQQQQQQALSHQQQVVGASEVQQLAHQLTTTLQVEEMAPRGEGPSRVLYPNEFHLGQPLNPISASLALNILEASYRTALPQSSDTNWNGYKPRHAITTPATFPKTPADIVSQPWLFRKMDPEALFFTFYYQPDTYQQYLAAQELKRQSWRYHKQHNAWFQRYPEPNVTTDEYEQGTYVYFDYNIMHDDLQTGWCYRRKENFTFRYDALEDELQVQPA